jgi:hypothetical protein
MHGIKLVRYNGSNNFNDVSMGSEHPSGCHFLMGDASVKFVNENIDMVVYRAAASRNGREALSID